MWILGASILTVIVIYLTLWIILLNTPKNSTRALPPGSKGFPFIGETLHLMIPSYSLDLHPFIKKRIHRYGPIFRTNLFGRPVVISADSEFNNYLAQQEGRLVEIWLGPLANFFVPDTDDKSQLHLGLFHKHVRNLILSHVGAECMKEKLLSQLECMIRQTLHKWSSQSSIELRQSTSNMAFHFFAKHYFGYGPEKSLETGKISEHLFTIFANGLMSIPLNFPGTTYHKCLQEGKKAYNIIKKILNERRNLPENYRGDFLDQAIKDLKAEKIMTDDQIVYTIIGIWFATCAAISVIVTLMFKFLSENPSVIEDLTVEHEEILKSKDKSSSSLTWDEYKSMKFTQQVINEALRFSVLIPGVLRTSIKDIQVKEYTIPAGWIILMANPVAHLNPEIYKDPLTFNPWRWKELDANTVSKSFKPFGGGSRQCPGAELTRAFLSTLLHILVTKYRWEKIKGGNVVRNPTLGFADGIHIKLWEKEN